MRTEKYVLEELKSFRVPTQGQMLEKVKEDFIKRGLEYPKEATFIGSSTDITVGETKGQAKLLTTSCNFGGFRYWYECPVCHKRAYKLYRKDGFMCRKCFPSIYEKQTYSHKQRDRLFFLDKLCLYDDLEGKRLVYKGKMTRWGKKKLTIPALLS